MAGKARLGQIARRFSLQVVWPRMVYSLHQHLAFELCLELANQALVKKSNF
jgi:hypothetical protein